MQLQISDIEVGDWVLVRLRLWLKVAGVYKNHPYFYKGAIGTRMGVFCVDSVWDICKQNKHAQQDIISRTVEDFDLALANEVNSRINNLVKYKEKL